MEKEIRNIEIKNYRYDLPEDRIAKFPLDQRDSSKLLVYENGQIKDRLFSQLAEELPGDSVIVRNNTKVIQARLEFYKESGAKIQVFCLEPENPPEYESNLTQPGHCTWYCLIGNAKKWKSEILNMSLTVNNQEIKVYAERLSPAHQQERVKFRWTPKHLTLSEILDHFGQTPIPPYLQRESQPLDKDRYQTIYAQYNGSVAAPTAGLHFTPKINEQLASKDIATAELTLHVGAGTFIPVKTNKIKDHVMHTEHVQVSRDCLHDILNNDKKGVTAVGTTTLRTLESLYWYGYLLKNRQILINDPVHIDQWLPYQAESQLTRRQALLEIVVHMANNSIELIDFTTSLIILPGYHIRMADRLITNFHQPGSTLLLLVAAITGDNWINIYQHALEEDYRFLSYGDSSLIHLTKPYI